MNQPGVTALSRVPHLSFQELDLTCKIRVGPHLQNQDPDSYILTFSLSPPRPPDSCSTVLAPFFLCYFEVPCSNTALSYKAPQAHYFFLCVITRLRCRPPIAGKLSFSSRCTLSSWNLLFPLCLCVWQSTKAWDIQVFLQASQRILQQLSW